MKAIIYARVSSREQEEGYSLSAQVRLLKEYAGKHGFEVIKEYTDVETAKRIGRTSFQLTLEDIQAGKASVLLVEKTDRMTRNFKDYVAVDDLIHTQGLEVHLVKEGEILGPESRSQTKFIHGIRVLMAKNYTDNLSEEVKKGMHEKAQQGHYPTCAPYGYRNNPETRLIDINEDEAPFVRQAFELYATGKYSLRQVCLKLAEDGYIFKANRPKISKGSLEAMLKRLIYTGDFMFCGKFHEGKHEPIVSIPLFEKAQQAFKRANKPKYTKHKFAFAGLMTCGHCGCSITTELKKGKYIYYRCTNGRGKCPNLYVREEKISKLFAETLLPLRISKKQLDWVTEQLRGHHQDEIMFHKQRTESLQRRQATLTKRVDTIYEDKLDGKITDDLWQRKHNEYKLELTRIEESLRQHSKGNLNYTENGVRILELSKNAHSLYLEQSPLEQRRILTAVLSNSILKDRKLSVTYREPFSEIAECQQSQEWSG